MVTRKEILLKFSHHIETHIDVVVEFIEIQSSAPFDFYFDE